MKKEKSQNNVKISKKRLKTETESINEAISDFYEINNKRYVTNGINQTTLQSLRKMGNSSKSID